MEIGKFLNKSASKVKSIIKEVATTLKSAGLTPSNIQEDEYEVMISDACKDIKSTHSKRATQVVFSLFGLDFLLGI